MCIRDSSKSLFPSKNYQEVRTQECSLASSVDSNIKVQKVTSVWNNFLSTDESGSDFEIFESEEISVEMVSDHRDKGRKGDKNIGLSKSDKGRDSLSGFDGNRESTSGFSIWSLMNSDIKMERNDVRSSVNGKGVKVTSLKLRNALHKRHFSRIENKLKKLLIRQKS